MSDKIKSDYEYSRETYYELLEKGKDSLETMMQVCLLYTSDAADE